tara:strand:+ start:9440 stop:10459 length:1020 start_codon:yes stop_codon:yes gene_type:complete
MYYKRIVVDFDDTLAWHKGRKFNEAAPNEPLINKLNNLYNQGWQIDIFTARGSISCKTREAASTKYRKDMETWLANNNVLYHDLSFDKPLAAYYIDDKGILPEDFMKVDIRPLEGGLSGGEIYTDGKLVHKQDENAHSTGQWFASSIGINTPALHRIVGDTITMDYIENDKAFFKENFHRSLAIVQETLLAMADIDPLQELSYQSYVNRIRVHAEASGRDHLVSNVEAIKDYNLKQTFAHGDFGIKNMLFTNMSVTMIDPISGVFGCTAIDCAKFIASLIINDYHKDYYVPTFEYLSMFNFINKDMLSSLVVAEITRVYKYHPNKKYIMECVKNVREHC